MTMNPFDQLEVARDLVRRDECERLFGEIVTEEKEREAFLIERTEYTDGYVAGLNFVLDLLDVRIGHLRDRWVDAR